MSALTYLGGGMSMGASAICFLRDNLKKILEEGGGPQSGTIMLEVIG